MSESESECECERKRERERERERKRGRAPYVNRSGDRCGSRGGRDVREDRGGGRGRHLGESWFRLWR